MKICLNADTSDICILFTALNKFLYAAPYYTMELFLKSHS